MVFSGHSITANVTALEIFWQRLLDVGEHIEESQVMAKILATLPGPYHYFYTVWNNGPADGRTIRLLLSKLQEEEAVQSLREPAPSQNDAAFSSSGGRFQRHYRPAPYHTPRGDYQAGTGGYRGGRAFHEARGAPKGGRGARGAPRGYRGGYRGFRGNSFHSNFDLEPLQLLSEGAAQRRELQNQTTDARSNAPANSWSRLSRYKYKCRS